MDDELQFEPEFNSKSPFEDHTGPDQYTGAFFPQAKHFIITGGKFTSRTNINQIAPTALPDFRVIPLGDLNLLHSIGIDGGYATVSRQRGNLRQMYSAGIHGSQSSMTAAVYQGNCAADEWRTAISRYSELRHPYILQIYGIISTAGLHATVFHDDLIPYTKLEEKYSNSHSSAMFFWACMDGDFSDVSRYISVISGRELHWSEYNVWIRSSTGRLCIDLAPPEHDFLNLLSLNFRPSGSLLAPPENWRLVTSMSLQDYHDVCEQHLRQWHQLWVASHVLVKLESIRHLSGSEYENSLEIACVGCRVCDEGWSRRDLSVEGLWIPINAPQEGISVMENGWVRINSDNVADEYCRPICTDCTWSSWLAQANHIFDCIEITSNFEDYVVVHRLEYKLEFLEPVDPLLPGFLFLCPLGDLQSDDSLTSFRIPDCPAYWSLDPTGAAQLSDESAKNLGFPTIERHMEVFGKSWDDRVYTGIRQFHEAKGFDPCGQDVARALGYPLFRPTCERDVLFAHLQENDASDYCSDSDGLSGEQEFWDQQSGPGDASSAQDTAIDSASRPYSTHHGQEDFLPRTNCLREIDVLNTSIVWEAAFAGDPPS